MPYHIEQLFASVHDPRFGLLYSTFMIFKACLHGIHPSMLYTVCHYPLYWSIFSARKLVVGSASDNS